MGICVRRGARGALSEVCRWRRSRRVPVAARYSRDWCGCRRRR